MTARRVSISLRLTLWFGGIFLLGWVLFGASMWFNLKHTLTDERRLTLSRRLDRLEALANKTRGESPGDRLGDYRDFARATGGGLMQIVRGDGARVIPALSSAADAFPWPAPFDQSAEQFLHVRAADQPYWVLTRPSSLDGHPVVLLAAAPEAGNLLVLDRFWFGLLASAPILLLVSSAGGYWLSRRALRPVDRIAAAARSISIRNLSERLPVTRSGDELQRLTETCNAMLARLESAVNQIKQFTADASHELRSPLSFVRTVAEVALRTPHIDPQSREALEDIVAEAARAASLLEDMLTLARADSAQSEAALEPLSLAAVVGQACDAIRPLAAEHRLALSVDLGDSRPACVLGDFSTLRRLFGILLDNALKYTSAPGSIHVALSVAGDKAAVLVRDTGSGIADSDLPHIFDRFYRADPSRSQIEGCGLGLAIARWIAGLHHAEILVTSQPGQGSDFRVVFPLCAPSPAVSSLSTLPSPARGK